MTIRFYHSALCPRCRLALQLLNNQVRNNNKVTIEKIDVVQHPLKALQERVFFIPTIISETGHRQSFFMVSEKKMIDFMSSMLDDSE